MIYVTSTVRVHVPSDRSGAEYVLLIFNFKISMSITLDKSTSLVSGKILLQYAAVKHERSSKKPKKTVWLECLLVRILLFFIET